MALKGRWVVYERRGKAFASGGSISVIPAHLCAAGSQL